MSRASTGSYEQYGRFRLLRRIAVGGMADIFLAHDPLGAGGQELVVIKRLRADKQRDAQYVDALQDEARSLRRLDHPNIVRALETGKLDGRDYIALEFVWGESLATLTQLCYEQRRFVPAEVAIYICAEVAAALNHAHRRPDASGERSPIIHRDVTLSNVMVSHSGQVKMLDFGIALAEERLARTQSGVVKGTLVYLAPEQVLGDAVSPQTDIYQLGVLLYKLLVGHEPFASVGIEAVLMSIVRGEIIDPVARVKGFPGSVRAVLMRALARDPVQRHVSAGELEAALRALLGTSAAEGQLRLVRWLETIAGNRLQRQRSFVETLLAGLPVSRDTVVELGPHPERTEPTVIYVEYSELFSRKVATEEAPHTVPEAFADSVRVDLDELRAYTPRMRSAVPADFAASASLEHQPTQVDARAEPIRDQHPDVRAADEGPDTLEPWEHTESNRVKTEPSPIADDTIAEAAAAPAASSASAPRKPGWRAEVVGDYFGSDTEIETHTPPHVLEAADEFVGESDITVPVVLPHAEVAKLHRTVSPDGETKRRPAAGIDTAQELALHRAVTRPRPPVAAAPAEEEELAEDRVETVSEKVMAGPPASGARAPGPPRGGGRSAQRGQEAPARPRLLSSFEPTERHPLPPGEAIEGQPTRRYPALADDRFDADDTLVLEEEPADAAAAPVAPAKKRE